MSGYERGLELEKIVAKLFMEKGYDVKHDVKLVGRSGVEHQIDVYVEYRAPFHVSRIIIECKSYDRPIDKDIVMKLIHEVEDLGVDRGILITTSYFTPDAASTAEGYNIDLWDGAKLRNILKELKIEEIKAPVDVFHVKPVISTKGAIWSIKDSLRGLLGKRRKIDLSLEVFYPFYEVSFDGVIKEAKGFIRKRVVERVVSSTILIGAIRGEVCDYRSGIGVVWMTNLPEMSEDEKNLLKILLTYGSLTVSGAAALLGCSVAKARKILQGLFAKKIVKTKRVKRQIFYRPIEIPDPTSLNSISKICELEKGEPEKGYVLKPEISIGRINELIEVLWNGEVKECKTIYYPYCACKIIENNKIYIKAVDLRFNTIDEKLGKDLTSFYLKLPF